MTFRRDTKLHFCSFNMANGQQPDDNDLAIKTREELSGSEIILESGHFCDFCKLKASKYTCPKCNLRYCSIDCYKGENHRICSESFYKDQVIRELGNMKSTDEEQKRTMKILKRVMQCEENEDYVWSDDEGIENLAKRMEDIDLDTASFSEMFCRLTEKEKKLFESVVQSGEVEIADICTPWWTLGSKHNGITEFHDVNIGKEEKDTESTITDQDIPVLMKDIPVLEDLLPSKKPSEKLPYSIIELVMLYCFLYRVYNGELKESLLEVLECFTNLSPVLADGHHYHDLETCIKSLFLKIKRSAAFKCNIDPIRVSLTDLKRVLSCSASGSDFINEVPMSLLCISELYKLFVNGLKEIKILKVKTSEMKERKILYRKITKKLLFMASWLLENNETVKSSSNYIEALQKELIMHWDSVYEDRKVVEQNIKQMRNNTKTKLIEEL